MKLNYRDLVILGILLALAILIAGFFLLIKPKNEEIKSNKATLADLETQKAEVDGLVAEIEPLKENITDVYNDTTKLTENFVDYNSIFNARKLDQYMQHFAEECEVKIMNLSAMDLSTGTLSYYYFTPSFLAEDQLSQADLNGDYQDANNSARTESDTIAARTQESVLLGQYSISVTAEDKQNIWDYMTAIEEQDETIIINSVTLGNIEIKEVPGDSKDDDEDVAQPTAQFVISLYSVYDLAQPNLSQE
ncbi:MAG: hypothetical protein NC340_02575 [Ruminococcus flavefaciens]|nr:hypothetical protein [Ruminococcus flavefaciens]MCM1229385.1 hypothetical protein [Ruminococcus flavefaciens]